MVECYKCLRPLPRAASPEKVKRAVYTGSSSSGLLFSENSVLNIILRRLLGRRSRVRSYKAMRVICAQCDAKIRFRRLAIALGVLGVLSAFGAYVWYEASSSNSYTLMERPGNFSSHQ
jgi:hypothetical protein